VKVRYLTADVFTDQPFGGNQLAVFPDASGIAEEWLLPITKEFNFSEVTFCYPPVSPEGTRRVRIFTPGGEIPFAGHPTIGTAHVLVAIGDVPTEGDRVSLVLEEGVGPVPVTVHMVDGAPVFAQFSTARLPEIGPPPPSRGVLADILGLDAGDIGFGGQGPQSLSVGYPFLLVPVRDSACVSRARVRVDRWEETLKASWAPEILVFALDQESGPTQYRARMFAPGINISEDPATGSAAACLAGYLAARSTEPDVTLRWTITQGVEMGRPSRLEIEADRAEGALRAIRVGGATVLMSEGTLHLPPPRD
jgi:trans-2,3-dihydro-3-hydroxyanthranilate isomerase